MKMLFFFVLLSSSLAYGQLSGEIVDDKRVITSDIDYTITMPNEGKLVFDIAVDTKGNVTSCTFNRMESTINSARYKVEAKNRILTGLKFEYGNKYPQFHQGRVTITQNAG